MTRLLVLLLLALPLLVQGCDGGSATGPTELRGEWLATHRLSDGARTEDRFYFGADGTFRHEYLWYGFHGLPATELTGYSRTAGRYRVEGDSLHVLVGGRESWQKLAVGPNPTVTRVRRPRWAEHGTVRVEGDRLFHTTVSAPADAPQVFTQEYRRVR